MPAPPQPSDATVAAYRLIAGNVRELLAEQGIDGQGLAEAVGWTDRGKISRLLAWATGRDLDGRQAARRWGVDDLVLVAAALGLEDRPDLLLRPIDEIRTYLRGR